VTERRNDRLRLGGSRCACVSGRHHRAEKEAKKEEPARRRLGGYQGKGRSFTGGIEVRFGEKKRKNTRRRPGGKKRRRLLRRGKKKTSDRGRPFFTVMEIPPVRLEKRRQPNRLRKKEKMRGSPPSPGGARSAGRRGKRRNKGLPLHAAREERKSGERSQHRRRWGGRGPKKVVGGGEEPHLAGASGAKKKRRTVKKTGGSALCRTGTAVGRGGTRYPCAPMKEKKKFLRREGRHRLRRRSQEGLKRRGGQGFTKRRHQGGKKKERRDSFLGESAHLLYLQSKKEESTNKKRPCGFKPKRTAGHLSCERLHSG